MVHDFVVTETGHVGLGWVCIPCWSLWLLISFSPALTVPARSVGRHLHGQTGNRDRIDGVRFCVCVTFMVFGVLLGVNRLCVVPKHQIHRKFEVLHVVVKAKTLSSFVKRVYEIITIKHFTKPQFISVLSGWDFVVYHRLYRQRGAVFRGFLSYSGQGIPLGCWGFLLEHWAPIPDQSQERTHGGSSPSPVDSQLDS